MKFQLLKHAARQLVQFPKPDPVWRLGGGDGVGAGEGLQVERILPDIPGEARPRQRTVADALHEGLVEASLCQIGVGLPERVRKRHAGFLYQAGVMPILWRFTSLLSEKNGGVVLG